MNWTLMLVVLVAVLGLAVFEFYRRIIQEDPWTDRLPDAIGEAATTVMIGGFFFVAFARHDARLGWLFLGPGLVFVIIVTELWRWYWRPQPTGAIIETRRWWDFLPRQLLLWAGASYGGALGLLAYVLMSCGVRALLLWCGVSVLATTLVTLVALRLTAGRPRRSVTRAGLKSDDALRRRTASTLVCNLGGWSSMMVALMLTDVAHRIPWPSVVLLAVCFVNGAILSGRQCGYFRPVEGR